MNDEGIYAEDPETLGHIDKFFTKNKVSSKLQTDTEQFPIGTLLPVFPPKGTGFKLPKGWAVCDGRTVVHPESPFKNTRLPNLTSDVFLMGTRVRKIGAQGGDNEIKNDGAHGHTGSTGGPSASEGCDNGGDKHPATGRHTHSFSTSTNGGHDHGGENRPNFFGVLYIIRIY